MIRVWIDSTSAVTRAGLESLLTGVSFVDSIADADVVLSEEMPSLPPDIAAPPFVVLTEETPPVRAMLAAGVRGILPHHADAAQIVAALYAAASGLVVVPAELAVPTLTAIGAASSHELETLTPRETETLEMLAEGLSNKQIAGRLNISEHTAKFHVNSILGKLRAGTRTEAVMRGIRSGILKV